MRRLLLAFAVLVALGSFALGLFTTASMADSERDARGEPQSLSSLQVIDHHQLVSATLAEGQRAYFEVCAGDGFQLELWERAAFTILFLPADGQPEVAATVRFDSLEPDWIQVGSEGGCVVFKRWDEVLVSGEFAIGIELEALELNMPDTVDPIVRGRILAHREVDASGRASVYGALLSALMLVFAFLAPPRKRNEFEEQVEHSERISWPAWARIAVGVGALLLTMFALGFVHGGPAMAAARALLIAAVQVGVAILLVRGVASEDTPGSPRVDLGLALAKPRPGTWILALMPFLGVAVWLVGSQLARLVPSTGLAPIEALVSFPSGSLAVALIAVFVPVAEEVFFRGFIYTTAERWRGANAATLISLALFALVHLPQQWGAWGAFVSVSFTGLVLTLLRRGTRSTLAPLLAHLAHNAAITILAIG